MPLDRRRLLAATLLAPLAPFPVRAHGMLGPVAPPRPAPALPLALHDGRRSTLPALLRGQVTALQLMFTGCSATCPIQGAVFAGVQARLGDTPGLQLLSLSIDALGDDPAALAAWRTRFGAGARWLAAVPPVRHSGALAGLIGAEAGTAGDRHSTQVAIYDAQAQLVYRCAEFASAEAVVLALMASRAGG